MDTSTDRKLSNRKFSSKSEKSWGTHTHIKQIILPSTILEFPLLVSDGFMEGNGLAPSSKKEIRSTRYRMFPRQLKFSHPLATRHKQKFQSPLKYLWVEGEYIPWNI